MIKYSLYCVLMTAILRCGELVTHAATELISYGYDPAGRLTSCTVANAPALSYHYDSAGNLLQIGTQSGTDSDQDGLEDAWETTHFGSLARTGENDFDADGLNDRAEFLAGTDPTSGSSSLRLNLVRSSPNSVTLSWDALVGKRYRVQFKNAVIGNWTDLSAVLQGTDGVMQTDDSALQSSSRFYRLELVP